MKTIKVKTITEPLKYIQVFTKEQYEKLMVEKNKFFT